MKRNSVFMHPLLRNGKISPEVDHDLRLVYYREIHCGLRIPVTVFCAVIGKNLKQLPCPFLASAANQIILFSIWLFGPGLLNYTYELTLAKAGVAWIGRKLK